MAIKEVVATDIKSKVGDVVSMKAILRILSDMNCKFELNSDTPGVTFDDGSFHLYKELPKSSEMLDRVEVLRTSGFIRERWYYSLKNCPFCGGDDIAFYPNVGSDYPPQVKCRICGATMNGVLNQREDIAINKWNTRVNKDNND